VTISGSYPEEGGSFPPFASPNNNDRNIV